MKTKTIEAWAWSLIYGGLLADCLGYFVVGEDPMLGQAIVVGGTTAAVAGLVLIVLRSRMGP